MEDAEPLASGAASNFSAALTAWKGVSLSFAVSRRAPNSSMNRYQFGRFTKEA